MNDRIRELREQAEEWVCKNYPDAMDDNDEFHSQTMAKFAELIVRECIAQCESQNTVIITDMGTEAWGEISDAVEQIKQHFGVEE
jgi:hypothetical protein